MPVSSRKGTRRANGEGSVGRSKSGGRIRGYVTLPDGSRQWVSGTTKAEVSAKVAELRQQQEERQGAPPADRKTLLRDYIREWIQRRSDLGKIRPSTLVRYEEMLRLYIGPHIGDHRLDRLRPEHVEDLYAWMLREAPVKGKEGTTRKGVKPSTVHKAHVVLHAALRDAERRRIILRSPLALVDAPPIPKVKKQEISMDDVASLLVAAEGDRLEAIYWLALETGLREGELFALRWSEVDLETGLIIVGKKVRRVANQGIIEDDPKSAAGDRKVFAGAATIAALKRRQLAQQEERRGYRLAWRKTERIFTNPAGGYLEGGNFRIRDWMPLLERAGLHYVTFHEFTRHGHGSLMASLNVDAATLRRRMGHSRIETTFSYYVHGVVGADQAAATLLDVTLQEAVSRVTVARTVAEQVAE